MFTCIFRVNQSIKVVLELLNFYSMCPVVPGRERGKNLASVIMEKEIFSFFKPIVLFYMNVAARKNLSDTWYGSTHHLHLPDLLLHIF